MCVVEMVVVVVVFVVVARMMGTAKIVVGIEERWGKTTLKGHSHNLHGVVVRARGGGGRCCTGDGTAVM